MSQEMKKEGVASAQGSAGAAVRKLNACEGSFGTHKKCVGQMSQSRLCLSSLPPGRDRKVPERNHHIYFHSVVLGHFQRLLPLLQAKVSSKTP